MDQRALFDGLIWYVCLVILVTFHEFGHAWMSNQRGDDTACVLGRISLNPIMHMDLIGTVILPLLAVFLGASGSPLTSFIIGWGKPVPVNPAHLRNRRLDWALIALAGPAMNVILAVIAMGAARVGVTAGANEELLSILFRLAELNLYLCFFNLLPIPPLDGSHVLRSVVGFSEELYRQFSQFGFIIIIFAIQMQPVQWLLGAATGGTMFMIAKVFAF